MNAIDTLMSTAILTFGDGDGPWNGTHDGEWWWWVIRPLTFILTFLVIAFIVRTVIFGGFRRFNGPGGGGGGGFDRDRDRDRASSQKSTGVQMSQATPSVAPTPAETPRAEAPPVETPPVESPGLQRARDILAERYARGEIDGEEYRGRLDQLG